MQGNEAVANTDVVLARAALDAAVDAAHAAADFIRASTPGREAVEWVEKGTADFVTEVDRGAEERIAGILLGRFRDATIVGEELTPDDVLLGHSLTFIVDPLDGTTNFLHGYPQYAVSIGVVHEAELIAGVVLNVPRGDLFTASRGNGARLNGDEVRVSSITNPGRSLIGTGFPFKNPELLEVYARQFVEVNRQTAGIRRAGSAALDLADLACGRFDGFWELILAPWDVAAGIMLVREAGGVVTNIEGESGLPSHGPVVAGNPDIHAWLLETIRTAPKPDQPNQ